MMRPAVSAASPAPSCWIDALKLMKLPRSRGSTLPVTSAIAGPKRPVTSTKNSTAHGDDDGERHGGRCVVMRIGTIDSNARIVNTRFLP